MSSVKSSQHTPSELIISLDNVLHQQGVSNEELKTFAHKFDVAQSKVQYDSQDVRKADAFEFSGLVLYAIGDYEGAYKNFSDALRLIGNGQTLYSVNAGSWYYELRGRISNQRRKVSARRLIWSLVILATFIWMGFSSWYDSDEAVIARADPFMMSLADSASMTQSAKAIFARTDPTLVDSATIQEMCQSDVVGDVVEQGCFDPNSEKIYIRDLPTDLDQGEITTVAHEMLHAAMNRDGMSDSETSALNSSLADPTISAAINALLVPYGEISSDAKQLESQAFLGTTYPQLPPEMEAYYAKYFSDGRQALLGAYSAVKSIFDARKQALAIEEQNIQVTYNNAETYYANHAYYGRIGNRYAYENAYSLYSQTYNSYSRQVDQYNIDVHNYNELVAGYAGVPLSQLETKNISN